MNFNDVVPANHAFYKPDLLSFERYLPVEHDHLLSNGSYFFISYLLPTSTHVS